MEVDTKLSPPAYPLPRKVKNRIISVFNWTIPNLMQKLAHKILLTGKSPICNQLTKITGEGKVEIGTNCVFGYKLGGFHRGGAIEFQARYEKSFVKLGENIATNNNVFICAANYIEIGSNTLIGQYVTIMDHEAHGVHPLQRRNIGEIGSVIIGENVWIGNNVIILKKTEIGKNSVVAAGAIVSGTFPENVIIGGIPAKIIKTIDV